MQPSLIELIPEGTSVAAVLIVVFVFLKQLRAQAAGYETAIKLVVDSHERAVSNITGRLDLIRDSQTRVETLLESST